MGLKFKGAWDIAKAAAKEFTYAVSLTDQQRAEQGIPTQQQVEALAHREQRPAGAPNIDNSSPRPDRREE